jgi:hypothetical protein
MTKKREIKMERIGVVYDGNKLYHLTNEEWQKSLDLLLGRITTEDFENKVLKDKPYTILPPRKNPYV